MSHRLLICLLLVTTILCGCFDNHPKADLVIFNANIYTVNPIQPKAEAIAVKKGKIVYVGNNVNANDWVSDSTQVVDIAGKTMVPGFIEGHGHLMGLGDKLMSMDLSGAESYKEVIGLVGQKIKTAQKGEWIFGRGWHQDKWELAADSLVKGFPIHDSLSLISPQNPVVLTHASGHAILVNKRAMQLAGVYKKGFDTDRADIILDSNDKPTGMFLDEAMALVYDVVPKQDDETKIEALNLAIEQCLRNGVTSFQDAGTDQRTINLYHSFQKNKLLKIRIYAMIDGSDHDLVDNWFVHGPAIGMGNQFLTVRAIKLYADGALGPRTALLQEPYTDDSTHSGLRLSSLDYIMRISEKAFQKGFQVCTHAIGDRANKDVLDLYEIVLKSDTTKKDVRFRVEHAQHLRAADIPRFGELGIIPSVQAIHMSSDRPWAIDRLGSERIQEGAYVWRKLMDTGATLVNGTDVPVEPINPIANFYAAVTRQTLDGQPPGGFEADQKMTREEALRSLTINNAYGAFEEKIKGSIEMGKVADLVILSRDIMAIPDDEILSAEVEYTIVDGKILYKK